MSKNRVFDLEDRLIDFSVLAIEVTNSLPGTQAGQHFSGQLIRSGSSSALNYGEAQAAESRKDFIHKSKIILKELRESMVCLKIIQKANLCPDISMVDQATAECNELISIFVKSIQTAQRNLDSKKHF